MEADIVLSLNFYIDYSLELFNLCNILLPIFVPITMPTKFYLLNSMPLKTLIFWKHSFKVPKISKQINKQPIIFRAQNPPRLLIARFWSRKSRKERRPHQKPCVTINLYDITLLRHPWSQTSSSSTEEDGLGGCPFPLNLPQDLYDRRYRSRVETFKLRAHFRLVCLTFRAIFQDLARRSIIES